MMRISNLFPALVFTCVSLLLSGSSIAAQGDPTYSCDTKKEIGCVLTSLDGVQVRYNGTDFEPKGEYEYGSKWQCVELVQRYYSQVYHYEKKWVQPFTKYNVDYAWQIIDEGYHPSQMKAFLNGSPTRPQKGDVLVFDKIGDSGSGHVAIIKSVNSTQVTFVQQNVRDVGEDSLPIGDRNRIPESSYGKVRGWLRDAGNAPPPAPQPSPTSIVQTDTLKLPIRWWVKFVVSARGNFELKLDNKVILKSQDDQATRWEPLHAGNHQAALYANQKNQAQFFYSWWPFEPVIGGDNIPNAPTPTTPAIGVPVTPTSGKVAPTISKVLNPTLTRTPAPKPTLTPTKPSSLTRTKVYDYYPQQITGEKQGGKCGGRSMDMGYRSDAWRCSYPSGGYSYIVDPCFSIKANDKAVLCSDETWTELKSGIFKGYKLNLTQPLPLNDPAWGGAPGVWMLELADGDQCVSHIPNMIFPDNYKGNDYPLMMCNDSWLMSSPNQGQIWTVQKISIAGDGSTESKIQVQIKTVWR